MSTKKKPVRLSVVGQSKVISILRSRLYDRVEHLLTEDLGKELLVLGTTLQIGVALEVVVKEHTSTDNPQVVIMDEYGEQSGWLN